MASDKGSRPSTSDSLEERQAVEPFRSGSLAPEDINLIAGAIADIHHNPPTDPGVSSTVEARTDIFFFHSFIHAGHHR